jgi:hypothetical protein
VLNNGIFLRDRVPVVLITYSNLATETVRTNTVSIAAACGLRAGEVAPAEVGLARSGCRQVGTFRSASGAFQIQNLNHWREKYFKSPMYRIKSRGLYRAKCREA